MADQSARLPDRGERVATAMTSPQKTPRWFVFGPEDPLRRAQARSWSRMDTALNSSAALTTSAMRW
jgi:hypothetical protein